MYTAAKEAREAAKAKAAGGKAAAKPAAKAAAPAKGGKGGPAAETTPEPDVSALASSGMCLSVRACLDVRHCAAVACRICSLNHTGA